MRRFLTILALAAVTAAWSAPAAAAGFAPMTTHAWEGLFTGSRLSAMGGADLAGDDGPGALLVNPAPLLRGDGVAMGHDHVDFPLVEYPGITDVTEDLDYVATTVGVEWHDWRFSACLSDESLDNSVIRTAYQPEGMGTINRRSRMALVGLARQLAGSTRTELGLQWTVGVAYRSYSTKTAVSEGDLAIAFDDGATTGTWDAGTTVAYRFAGETNLASLAAAIVWQNLADGKWSIDDRELDLPQVVRAGVSTELTFLAGQREWVRVVAAIARSEYSSSIYDQGFNHLGIEVTVLRLLALRAGSNDRFYGGSTTWGAGLVLDQPRGLPLELAVDYGEIARDESSYSFADIPMWSGRVRWEF